MREVNIVIGTICLLVLLGCAEPRDVLSIGSSMHGSLEPAYVIDGVTVQPNGSPVSLLATVRGDLNGDGNEDLAAIVVNDSDGSGVFFYLNVFVGDENGGWRLIGEELLGDRVKLDMLDIYSDGSLSSVSIPPRDDGLLVVAYFVHADEQSFVEEPARYITKYWRVADEMLIQIEDD